MIFAQALAFAQWQGGASCRQKEGLCPPLWLLFPEDSRAQSLYAESLDPGVGDLHPPNPCWCWWTPGALEAHMVVGVSLILRKKMNLSYRDLHGIC